MSPERHRHSRPSGLYPPDSAHKPRKGKNDYYGSDADNDDDVSYDAAVPPIDRGGLLMQNQGALLIAGIGSKHDRQVARLDAMPLSTRLPELGDSGTEDENGANDNDDDVDEDDAGSEHSGTIIPEGKAEHEMDIGDINELLERVAKRRASNTDLGDGTDPPFRWNTQQSVLDYADDEGSAFASEAETGSSARSVVLVLPDGDNPMIQVSHETEEPGNYQKESPKQCSKCSSTGPVVHVLQKPEDYMTPIDSSSEQAEASKTSRFSSTRMRNRNEAITDDVGTNVQALCESCLTTHSTSAWNYQSASSTDDDLAHHNQTERDRHRTLENTRRLQKIAETVHHVKQRNLETYNSLSPEGQTAFRKLAFQTVGRKRTARTVESLFGDYSKPCAVAGCVNLGPMSEWVPQATEESDGVETKRDGEAKSSFNQLLFPICDEHIEAYESNMKNPDPTTHVKLQWDHRPSELWQGIRSRASERLSQDNQADFINTVLSDPSWRLLTDRICSRNATTRGICAEEKFPSLPYCPFHIVMDVDKQSYKKRHRWLCSGTARDRTRSCLSDVDNWFAVSLWDEESKPRPLCESHLSRYEKAGHCVSCLKGPASEVERGRSTVAKGERAEQQSTAPETTGNLETRMEALSLDTLAIPPRTDGCPSEEELTKEIDREEARQRVIDSLSGGIEELGSLCLSCYQFSSYHALDPNWLEDLITARIEGRSVQGLPPWIVRTTEIAAQPSLTGFPDDYDSSD